jgi:histone deacetylase HOS3
VFADKWANGKVISVLEGGYSDRALATGAMSHIHGFARAECEEVPASWWSEDNVAKVCRFAVGLPTRLLTILLRSSKE